MPPTPALPSTLPAISVEELRREDEVVNPFR
jgi:hypothetical protein